MSAPSRAETRYTYGVMASALVVVVYDLLQWRHEAPDVNPVVIVALVLVPLAVRTQVTVSRGDTDLTLGASAAALFSSDLSRDVTILPLWALLVSASYVVFHRDETWGQFRAGIQVLGGAALVSVAHHVDFGVRPYDRVVIGLLAYFLVITLLEMLRRAYIPVGQDDAGTGSLLSSLRWAWIYLVGTGIFYVAAAVAVARRLVAGIDVPLVPTLVVALLGAVAVALGLARRTLEMTRSLTTVVDAAVAMPWRRESIHSSVREWAVRALRTDQVEVRLEPPQGREMGVVLEDGHQLVARRAAGDLPFSLVEHQVLDALAHMASVSMRRADTEDHLVQQATTDSLSGLPTYSYFRDQLDQLGTLREQGELIGTVFIDLDGFKLVNDRLGHFAGDLVIRELSARLRTFVGEGGLLTRFGGDEFALVVRDVDDLADLQAIANRLLKLIAEPIIVDGEPIIMAASLGLALSTDRDDDMAEVVRVADREMYVRKRQVHAGDEPTLRMDDEIRTAIQQQRIDTAFQPLVLLENGTIRGWEVLVRYEAAGVGEVPPLTIVGVAKKLGLLDALTRQVADQAFDLMMATRDMPGAPTLFSLNLELDQFAVWSPLLDHLVDRVRAGDSRLMVEISERDFERWSSANTLVAQRLLAGGIRLAIDDFGTGYSALGALHKAPAHVVKLDRSLLQEAENPRQRIVLRRVVGMLGELGFRVIAEGVQDPHVEEILRDYGVEYGQGNFYGMPVRRQEVIDRLREHGGAALHH